jgi:hypothetical protein
MAGAKQDLISKLRSRLSDLRTGVTAFTLTVTGSCRYAYTAIENGYLTVTLEQPQGISPVRFALSDTRINTVGRLIQTLDALEGYTLVADTAVVTGHPSTDLAVDGIPDAHAGPVPFRHHIFSDEELSDLLTEAITLHNPNYTSIATVPKSEWPYVLMKGQAAAYRVLAADTAKRKGLDTDAHTYLSLAHDMEEQYSRDHRRQERILPAPKADESKMGAGDVVNGMMFRRSLRAGYNASYRNSLPPQPPNLYDFADDDVEDTQIRVRFSQNREQSFSYYELWRDFQPNVERSISGRLTSSYGNGSTPPGGSGGAALPINTQYSRAATAKQVLGVSAGANRVSPVFDGFFFWTAAELAGSNIVNCSFIDGVIFNNPGAGTVDVLGEPLEPDSDYYYRLFGINWNGEVTGSKVLKTHTKHQRAKFLRQPGSSGLGSVNAANSSLSPGAITPNRGILAGGVPITVQGTNFAPTGLQLLLNNKPCTGLTILSPTTLTCFSPVFTNTDFIGHMADMVLISQNGLRDIVIRAWTFL